MLRYDLILMDADNTLYDFDASEACAIREVLPRIGISAPDAPQVYSRINAACWLDYNRGKIAQGALRVRRFRELLDHYGVEGDAQACNLLYSEALSRQCIPLPGALEAVRAISARLPIAVLTNGLSDVQHRRFDRSPLRPYIRDMLVSSELGHPKPEPHMYQEALRRFGVSDPRRALMIGDSLSSDILGANRAGVDACWFNPGRLKRTEEVRIDCEIHATAEMPAVALREADEPGVV